MIGQKINGPASWAFIFLKKKKICSYAIRFLVVKKVCGFFVFFFALSKFLFVK